MTEKNEDFGNIGSPFLKWARDEFNKAKRLSNQLKVSKDQNGFLDTLMLYNEMETSLSDPYQMAQLRQMTHPDEGMRKAAEVCEQECVALMTEFSLDNELYQVFASMDIDDPEADDISRRLVEKVIRGFRRSGVDKDEATRDKVRKLNEELTEISQNFERNIREGTRYIEIDSADELAGLPEDFVSAHKPDENGKIKLCTDMTDLMPILTYADSDDVRYKLWYEKQNIAFPDNETVLQTLIEKRDELAKTLDYDNWAHYATEEMMIKTSMNARSFIERVASLARARSKSDSASLLEYLQKSDEDAIEVNAWQGMYLTRLVKEERYSYDPKQMRPYFDIIKVQQGILDISERLFGLEFVADKDAEIWHEDVQAFLVKSDNQDIGRIYLDLYPRENKYKHAAMFPIVSGIEGKRIPEGGIICNFPDPSKHDGPALMEYSQVVTFFHEFGHLLHHILGGNQRWLRFSGVETEWDFVEVPSQLYEEWARDYEMLASFATNEKDEVLPKELVDKMLDAADFGKGNNTMQQMAYASISLGIYDKNPGDFNMREQVDAILDEYSPYPVVDGAHFENSFGHLVGYSSNYYTYMWSLVIAKDIYQVFKDKGLDDKELSLSYSRSILTPGGSKDASLLVKDFLGREFSFDAFEQWMRK